MSPIHGTPSRGGAGWAVRGPIRRLVCGPAGRPLIERVIHRCQRGKAEDPLDELQDRCVLEHGRFEVAGLCVG